MNKLILDSILSKYQSKRNLALIKNKEFIEKASKFEEFNNLDKQIKQTVYEIGKLKFEQKNTNEEIKKLNKLKLSRDKFLLSKGLNPLFLNPIYDCAICNDMGYVNGKMCNCLKQSYNNAIMKCSNIELEKLPDLIDYEMECFEKEEKNNVNNIVKNLINFANNMKVSKTKNILLVGGTGVGKTYLAKCLGKQVLQNGNTVLFITAFNLNNIFLKTHVSNEINKIQVLQDLIDVDLLIIDDLGTEPMLKNVTKEYLLLLLNERINAKKSTVITTNLMPNNILNVYLERIYSRLFNKQNCALLNLKGKDLRIN